MNIYIDAYAWDCFLFSFKNCIQCKKDYLYKIYYVYGKSS